MPEHLAGVLEIGQEAEIMVPAFPGRVFAAHLAHLGALADAESGTVEAGFHVAFRRGHLRIAPHLYNDASQIDGLLTRLDVAG